MISAVLIIPAELQARANLVSVAMGHDTHPGNTYSLPLSATGSEPATHYGTHTWATPQFVGIIGHVANKGDLPPAPWDKAGLTEQDVRDVVQALIMTTREDVEQASAHWHATLAANGLQQIRET
jgi:CRISPR/Cas system type I-B associated protein Csh2 (Cas7 group RAMP superfamily)